MAEFSTVARLPSIGGLPAGTYVTLDNTTEAGFETYIQGYSPNGWTNWEDALRVARYLAPRPNAAIPHLVVFLTDGDPTAAIDNNDVTPEEYTTKVPLAESEVRSNISESTALPPAIPNANAIKVGGFTHTGAWAWGRPSRTNSR